MRDEAQYDVVVVGASIAGCTTATLFARRGLQVALIERNADASSYKAMCGHWILGGTKATLERAGFWEPMIEAGAAVERATVWGGDGWIESPEDVPPSISLRRVALDPLLRSIVQDEPNVDLRFGAGVTGVVRDADGRVSGVEIADGSTVRARLVVGADGHRSAVATAAGVPSATAPNGRCFWWAYYRGVELPHGYNAMVWPADPDGAVAVPAGNGLHLIGAFASKAHSAEFKSDRVGALERYVARYPDAPDLAHAERVSNAIGTSDYPFVWRDPLPQRGLALVGDASAATDPLPAVGCGWAFRSAEWLVDAAAPGLLGGEDLDAGLDRYREARSIIRQYDELASADAVSLESSEQSRAVRRAAVHDAEIARRVGMFAVRAATPDVLLNPDTIQRVMALR